MKRYEGWEGRLREEEAQLRERVEKLRVFLKGDAFKGLPAPEQALLSEQEAAMGRYLWVLGERIKLIPVKG